MLFGNSLVESDDSLHYIKSMILMGTAKVMGIQPLSLNLHYCIMGHH